MVCPGTYPSTWARLLTLLLVILSPSSLLAQGRVTSYPNELYYSGFGSFYEGDFRDAARVFRRANSGSFIGVDGKWIDSICYHTMLGESLYRLGDLSEALAQYEAALQIAISDPTWLSQVEFPPEVMPSGAAAPLRITWGRSNRATTIGAYPNSMSVLVGRANAQEVLQRGGVFQPPQLRPFDVIEISRCTALAARRRNEILGPLTRYDPLTAQLLQAMRRGLLPADHWGRPLSSIPLASAMVAAGDIEEAGALLQESLQVARRFDHPLTGGALLELGRVHLMRGALNEAGAAFLEATYAGASFGQPDIVEEGFRWGTQVHLTSRAPGAYAPLAAAVDWARTEAGRTLQVSLPLCAAECALAAGDSVTAANLIATATQRIGRTDLGNSQWGARLAYASAHANFQAGDVPAALTALGNAMRYQQQAGLWLYRLGLVDRFVASGAMTERTADELYAELLREPRPEDWAFDPMETLSVVLTPHPVAYERWLKIVAARRELDRAIEIADRLKRHRFFSSLPMGGRELALRWMLAAPRDALAADAVQQRQNLLQRHATLLDLVRRADEAEAALAAIPLVVDEKSPERRDQQRLLETWGAASIAVEASIGDLALRRESTSNVFPPLTTVADLQAALPEKTLVWYFVETSDSVLVAMITKGEYALEPLASASRIRPALTKFLRGSGMVERNAPVSSETLEEAAWKAPLEELRTHLAPTRNAEFWEQFEEVIIVPDGVLWYLPFEALPVAADDDSPLIEHVAIRYAPTLGTCVSPRKDHLDDRATAVVVGKLFPKDAPEVAEAWFTTIAEKESEAVAIRRTLPGPSALISGLGGKVWVLDDLDLRGSGPFGWAPLGLDQGKPASTLGDWMALPWRGPNTLLLPGFHSAAEAGLKGNPDGSEIFLAACGLMASGTRTAALARWRMGGESSFQLMHDFSSQLKELGAARAWQQAVTQGLEAPLDPAQEPRLVEDRTPFPEKRSAPLFWSGYLILDDGRLPPPPAAEAAGEEPAAEEDGKAAADADKDAVEATAEDDKDDGADKMDAPMTPEEPASGDGKR